MESLFNEAAGLNVCNAIKKGLQHRRFSAKLAKCLRKPFLQKSFSGCFWRLSRVFRGVPSKNWYHCQQLIQDSDERKHLLPRKSRSSHRRCSVKEILEGTAQLLSCEYYEVFKGATNLQPKITFVSTTKIGESTTNTLNYCFLQLNLHFITSN